MKWEELYNKRKKELLVDACIDAIAYIALGAALYVTLDKIINMACPENMKYLAKLGNIVICSSLTAERLYRLYRQVKYDIEYHRKLYQRLYQEPKKKV